MTVHRPAAKPAALWWCLLAALAAGAWFRLAGIRDQILGGDEFHPLYAAFSLPFPEILYSYGLSDHCIPLTLYALFIAKAGIPCPEWLLRVPVLITGLVAIPVLPLLARPYLNPRSTAVFGFWLALSPVLVFYSRIFRSYMPIAGLGFVALLACIRWLDSGSKRFAVLYIVCAWLAVYFHLLAGMFVCIPVVWALIEKARFTQNPIAPSWQEILTTGMILLLLLAMFLLPGARSLLEVLNRYQFSRNASLETLAGVSMLQAGTGFRFLTLAFWLLVLAGVALLWRRHPRAARFVLIACLAQLTSILVLSPFMVHWPLICNRYLITMIPGLLMFASVGLVGLVGLVELWPGQKGFFAWLPVALLMIFLPGIGGPNLPGWPGARSNFWGHDDVLDFRCNQMARVPEKVPAFYEFLKSQPEELTLIEFPWPLTWNQSHVLPAYQQIHQKRVLLSTGQGVCYAPPLAFRNLVRPTPEDLLKSDARYFILHLDIVEEERAIPQTPCHTGGYTSRKKALFDHLRHFAGQINDQLTREWGPPDSNDSVIAVWDLDRIR